jgi:hypothetical protein
MDDEIRKLFLHCSKFSVNPTDRKIGHSDGQNSDYNYARFFVTVTSMEGKNLYSKVYYAIIQISYIKEHSQYHKIHAQ